MDSEDTIEWGMKLLVFNAPSAMKKTMFGFGAAEASANAESPTTTRMMSMIRRVRCNEVLNRGLVAAGAVKWVCKADPCCAEAARPARSRRAQT